jgi:hypothetical protein
MPPPELEKPNKSLSSIIFFSFLALAALVGIALLSVLWVGAAIVLGGIFLFAAFHYLVWGWWLGQMIHDEQQDEQNVNDNDPTR